MDATVLKNLFDSFDIMWRGMLGLFVVCGGIALIMIILSKLIKGRDAQE